MATPSTIIHLAEAASTQDEARRRWAGASVLVTASRQTAGRGRSGAVWETADRAIAASVAFAPVWAEADWVRIPAVAGLAALDVVGPEAMLEWPNDVMVGGRKVAGILVEAAGGVVVAGMGVNLWWPQPIDRAGSLFAADPGSGAGPSLAERWAESLLDRMAGPPDAWGRERYQARCSLIGRAVTWEPDGAGTAVGIAPSGGLIVETAAGRTVLDSGVVRAVRAAGDPSADG
jgi:BirA family biotin operon repressor/biotin-[acetyl-CoA-carboxylase] ligase